MPKPKTLIKLPDATGNVHYNSREAIQCAREVKGCFIPTGFGSMQFHEDLAAYRIDECIGRCVAKALAAEQKKAQKLVTALEVLKIIHWPLITGVKPCRTIKIIQSALKAYRRTRTKPNAQT